MTKRIVDLPAAAPLTGAEQFPMWQNGVTVQATLPNVTPTVINLRQLGVTASTSAAFNTNAILSAINLIGGGGTLVVPNFGNNQPVNHLGFTIPQINAGGLTLTGENIRSFDTGIGTWGSYLNCIDNTALGIGTLAGSFGLTVRDLTIGGGFYGLRPGPAGTTTQAFSFNNLRFNGPFGHSALAFAGHNEHGRVENIEFQSVGNAYGIEWVNEPQGTSALADILFDYIWCYGDSRVGIYLVNENPQESIQGVEIRNFRCTGQRYCTVAIRAPINGLLFSRGFGAESGNVLVSSGSKVDLFVDTTQYGAPVSMNAVGLVLKGTNSALSSSDFPILSRGPVLTLDLATNNNPVTDVNNSVGISSVINDPNAINGVIALGTDPGSGIDSHLPTYLGNLGSNQPIFDFWPRGPMFEDSATILQSFHEDVDEDYDLMLSEQQMT